jgi:hypothetical protein
VVYPRLIVLEAINRPTIGKDTRTMSKDNVVELKKPDVFVNDPITELVRNGARQILAKALEAEISINTKTCAMNWAVSGLYETVICLNGKFKPVSDRLR